jgi:hypothetical protein
MVVSPLENCPELLTLDPLGKEFGMSGIATTCALDFVIFRWPEIGWARREPALFDWLQPHLARRSMQTTAPQVS